MGGVRRHIVGVVPRHGLRPLVRGQRHEGGEGGGKFLVDLGRPCDILDADRGVLGDISVEVLGELDLGESSGSVSPDALPGASMGSPSQ